MRRRGAGAALALLALVLTGCASPAIDAYGYRGKIEQSARRMIGLCATARTAVELDLRGRMIANVTDNVVTDMENDSQSILTAFESRQPPQGVFDAVFHSADDVLQQAASTLTDLRIAVRREDRLAKRELVTELGQDMRSLHTLLDHA